MLKVQTPIAKCRLGQDGRSERLRVRANGAGSGFSERTSGVAVLFAQTQLAYPESTGSIGHARLQKTKDLS